MRLQGHNRQRLRLIIIYLLIVLRYLVITTIYYHLYTLFGFSANVFHDLKPAMRVCTRKGLQASLDSWFVAEDLYAVQCSGMLISLNKTSTKQSTIIC